MLEVLVGQTSPIGDSPLSMKILVENCFNQSAPLVGQFHTAAHVPSSHGHQEPCTGHDSYIKGITDVLQVVKDIQESLKNELQDIRTKMQSLDVVLADDMAIAFPTSFSFTTFIISHVKEPNKPNAFNY
ncbi:hypothetical protein Ddye_012678 [Dipteronia dyeriana]|uniref:Uncharacterized protein n=1 Tax=Dipteronia dyeriana TaxID=168575 RepID=A0AAD9X510_9ROSI|nr:hypothetical protein Ddye_012678 [Dipteronia dyeriana]